MEKWIAFDFDLTLIDCDGRPIEYNLGILQKHIDNGDNVYILTGSLEQYLIYRHGESVWFSADYHKKQNEIFEWLYMNGIKKQWKFDEITCIKKHNTVKIYDNSCV